MIGVTISGADAIAKAFRELERNLARKVIRKSLRAGAKVIQEEAKRRAPVLTGAGVKKIRVRASRPPRGTAQKYAIAFAVLTGEAKGPTWYMSLQELGFRIGSRKLGNARRKVEGKHFALEAMRAKEPTVQQQVARDIIAGIERARAGA